MQPRQPLLTVGIPTWNRARELQECLQLVAAQVEAVGEDVEIVVSDNASTDGTEVLLCQFESRLSFLRHSRNEKNLGPDRNFLEVFKRSSGKYVWLLSDDDSLADGALAEILRIIKTHEPSHIITNYYFCDEQRRIVSRQPQRLGMVAKDVMHADLNRTFLARSHFMSLMSINIYRRDLLDFAEYEANLGRVEKWIQVYIAAHVLSRNPDAYHSSFYAVLARASHCREDPYVFLTDLPETFSYMVAKFNLDRRVEKQIIRDIRTGFLSFPLYLVYRAVGTKISPRLIPKYYVLALLFPKSLILTAWKCKRFLSGKGFTIHPALCKPR